MPTNPVPSPVQDLVSRGLLPPRVILIGPIGTGKTHALKTLLDPATGIEEVCVLLTEPDTGVLADTDPERFHWHYLPSANASWADLIKAATQLNSYDQKTLANMSDFSKSAYPDFIKLLTACSDFKCDRTGKSFGPVDAFPSTRAFVLDSLSGLNTMAMNLVAGHKPFKAIGDWGAAMDQIERIINKLAVATQCPLVVTAHPERESDEITGASFVMVSTLGKKLAPRLPRNFSDVIFTKRTQANFSWSTTESTVDLKTRNLPFSDKLQPSFGPLFAAWRARVGAGASQPALSQSQVKP